MRDERLREAVRKAIRERRAMKARRALRVLEQIRPSDAGESISLSSIRMDLAAWIRGER